MRKYITLFFSVTFFLFACKGGKAPGNIIKHDQMVSLLTDIHIVDGCLYAVAQAPDTLYKYGIDKYQTVFKDHHTDSTQFRASLRYYTTQPVELQAIYDQVLTQLKQKTDSLSKPQKQYAIPKK